MIKRESNRSAICLLLSVAFFVGIPTYVELHGLEEDDDSPMTLITVPTLLLGFFGFWVLAMVFLARAKGYHGALGLLGVLWLIGTAVLVLLPDRSESPPDRPTHSTGRSVDRE